MAWQIKIGNFRLGLLDSVKIHRSVDLLADTAEIVLPGTVLNCTLDVEDKLKQGDSVEIKLGYNGEMPIEFSGYLREISTNDGKLALLCEDDLFLFRKPVGDKELKKTSLENLLKHIIRETGVSLSLSCTYEFEYEKFVIHGSTGYDILKKVQDETKANIYIKDGALHIHPAYEEVFGKVIYDFSGNVEKNELTYKKAGERKFEVEVEGQKKDGESVKVTVGTTGGDKRTVKVFGVTDQGALKKRGEEELKNLSYDGYEGSLTGWLIPYCDAGFSAEIRDSKHPCKNGTYYVTAVTAEFSEKGGTRKVQLGRKIG